MTVGGYAEHLPQLFQHLLKLTTVHNFLQKEKCSEFSMCSFLSLSSAMEFVCDHQQVPAMKSLIANGFVFVVIVNNIANLFATAVSEWLQLNCEQTDAQISMSNQFEKCMSVHLGKLHQRFNNKQKLRYVLTGTITCLAH